MGDSIRTFIAFKLPYNTVSSISNLQEGIRSYGFKVRWVRPENIHLTFKFLGNIDKAHAEKVGRAMSESVEGHTPVLLAVKGIGVFPDIKRPRVVWVGVTGQIDLLVKLQKRLDKKLEEIGIPRENRQFKSHLTLGRVKEKVDPEKFIEAMKEFEGFESETFILDRIILFKSELRPAGPVYTKLMSAHLKVSSTNPRG